jgi:hypothetical protein
LAVLLLRTAAKSISGPEVIQRSREPCVRVKRALFREGGSSIEGSASDREQLPAFNPVITQAQLFGSEQMGSAGP